MLITLKNTRLKDLFFFFCLPHLHTYYTKSLHPERVPREKLSIKKAGLQTQLSSKEILAFALLIAAIYLLCDV